MAASKGNQNGVKLKDSDIRQAAYKAYCEHLAKGKSKRSFVFRHPEFSCHYLTLESYMKDKIEFDPLQMELAYHEGYARWEQVAEDSAEGLNKDANTASLQMIMRNKFDWDKDRTDKENVNVEKFKVIGDLFERLDALQSAKLLAQLKASNSSHSE